MRYALYYAPERGSPLAILANSWLGRDPATGRAVAHPVLDGMGRVGLAAITSAPRRYGFHGTLKAPFELAEGASEADLVGAMTAFCASFPAFELEALDVALLDGFLAIVPSVRAPELHRFADEVVRVFDSFRATLSDADVERRNPGSLSTSQLRNLMRWGYPYVFEDFRFHMTLSARLDGEESRRVLAIARDYFATVLARPLTVDALTLFVEPEPGAPFEIHSRVPLSSGQDRKTA